MSKNSENVARVFGYASILLFAAAVVFGVYEQISIMLPLAFIGFAAICLCWVIYFFLSLIQNTVWCFLHIKLLVPRFSFPHFPEECRNC